MGYLTLTQHPEAALGALPDVRGFDVRTESGERVGRVGDVVLEQGGAPRYLDVESGGFFNPKRVLLPVEFALPEPWRRLVVLRTISRQQFKNLPEWSGKPEDIGWLTENLIRRACGVEDPARDGRRPSADVPDDPAFDEAVARARAASEAPAGRRGEHYDATEVPAWRGAAERDEHDERRALREAMRRAARAESEPTARPVVQTGEMGVRTMVDTERVRMPVRRMREDIVVERRPVTGMRAEDARPTISDDEIRIPLVEEEIVVTRRAVVKEEIVIRKRAVEETTEVEAELRRERVDIQPHPAAFGDAAPVSEPTRSDISREPRDRTGEELRA